MELRPLVNVCTGEMEILNCKNVMEELLGNTFLKIGYKQETKFNKKLPLSESMEEYIEKLRTFLKRLGETVMAQYQ
jgi:abortive infection bacteriophage resistance protein